MNYKPLFLVASIFGSVSTFATDKVYTITAYCPCKKCCGPNAKGITASGKKVKEGTTIAASRSIPFGTKLWIEGVGVRVVEDRLAKKFDDRIDVYFSNHQKALEFGKKMLVVKKVK